MVEKKKMPKCSSTTTRLRGVYNLISQSKYKQYQILSYKKPLTDDLKKQFGIKDLRFRYHYNTANEVLLDYQRFIVQFQNK